MDISNKKLKFVITLAAGALLSTAFLPTYVTAAETNNNSEKITVNESKPDTLQKNDLYIQLEQELADLQASNRDASLTSFSSDTTVLSQEQAVQLIEKYEGAAVTNQSTGVSYQIVSGAVNAFATSKAAMQSLAGTFRNNGHILVTGGTLVGLPLGVFGALIAAFSSGALSSKFYNAADIMDQWYASSSNQGGVRFNLITEYPISSANSTTEATIN